MAKELSDAARALGSRGGKKRAKTLTPAQRSDIARKGAKARWSKKGGKQ